MRCASCTASCDLMVNRSNCILIIDKGKQTKSQVRDSQCGIRTRTAPNPREHPLASRSNLLNYGPTAKATGGAYPNGSFVRHGDHSDPGSPLPARHCQSL